jgi:hypothetical protein
MPHKKHMYKKEKASIEYRAEKRHLVAAKDHGIKRQMLLDAYSQETYSTYCTVCKA